MIETNFEVSAACKKEYLAEKHNAHNTKVKTRYCGRCYLISCSKP